MKEHRYEMQVEWTGNRGEGTRTYRGYARDHVISAAGKAQIAGSSDPAFRGDTARYNPEELLVASLSACHMLSYLHLCAVNQVNVVEYRDAPVGMMVEEKDGGGQFVRVVLRPSARIASGEVEKAKELHEAAHRLCFIARSVKFPVEVQAEVAPASS